MSARACKVRREKWFSVQSTLVILSTFLAKDVYYKDRVDELKALRANALEDQKFDDLRGDLSSKEDNRMESCMTATNTTKADNSNDENAMSLGDLFYKNAKTQAAAQLPDRSEPLALAQALPNEFSG